LLRSYQSISPGPRLSSWTIRNTIRLDGEELFAPRTTPKLEDHPLSDVRDCLFNIFAATLHIGGRSSNRNLRTRHAVVTGTHLSRLPFLYLSSISTPFSYIWIIFNASNTEGCFSFIRQIPGFNVLNWTVQQKLNINWIWK
jgi:hypothetical protein